MAIGSKRLRRLALKQEKALKNGILPQVVTNLPDMPDGLREHYGDNYKLIFEYYNHNKCELKSLSKQNIKKVINTFARVTKHDQTNISKLCRPNVLKKSQGGKYASLFLGLPDDFDTLMEMDFNGAGRIFVHLTGNMCCVVAVAGEHY